MSEAEDAGAELLPILVAHVDERGRAFLEQVASTQGGVYLVLESPPTEPGLHALEVQTAGLSPLVLLAEPVGETTERGTPLRLRAPTPEEAPQPVKRSGEHMRITRDAADFGGGWPERSTNVRMRSVASDHDEYIGRSLAGGKLIIEARVGSGGVGTVYRARHRDLMMPVAVKLMHSSYQEDPSFRSRFHAEALAASRLDHKNLTRVLDFGQEPDGLFYLAMEFLDGRSLRDLIHERSLVSGGECVIEVGRALALMMQVCSALTHAHARGIIHRDIKPENLVIVRGLDEDGHETDIIKVCDFGIAHVGTGTSVVHAGTAEYMSPELLRGELPSAQSDVYACGVVLYELLTGKVPIEGEVHEVARQMKTVMVTPPSRVVSGVDPRVDELVMKALEKERARRHATVRELRADVKGVLDSISAWTPGAFTTGGYWRELDSAPPSQPASSVGVSSDESDWLEHQPSYFTGSGFAPSSGPTTIPPVHVSSSPPAALSTPPASGTIGSLPPDEARAIAPFLKQLAETQDVAAFQAMMTPLSEQIQALLDQGSTASAWRLASTLELIASDPHGGQRASLAQGVLALFGDLKRLGPIADIALDSMRDRDGTATKLIVRAGNVGAHAMYSARVRLQTAGYDVRERFIHTLKGIGRAGQPTIKNALELLESRLSVPGAVAVAEDLLKALPDAQDDELGPVVARYTRASSPSLALLATNALPRVWREHARAVVLPLIHHTDDEIAVAALKHVRLLGGVDVDVIQNLHAIIVGTTPARTPIRIAAIQSLLSATPDARSAARAVLVEVFGALQGTGPELEDLVVAVASALLSFNGGELVTARYRAANGQLRIRLEAVLRTAR